jgi:hypothetical protein
MRLSGPKCNTRATEYGGNKGGILRRWNRWEGLVIKNPNKKIEG